MSHPSMGSPPGGGSAGSGVGDQARRVADDVKQEARSFAEDGKSQGAERLKGVADTVDRVADEVADQSPAMAEWVRKAAAELDGMSRGLKDKSLGDLLTMGRDFARREPAAFVAASAVAGFALSRLLKSTSAPAAPSGAPMASAGPEPSAAAARTQPPILPAMAPPPVAPDAQSGSAASKTASKTASSTGGATTLGGGVQPEDRGSGGPASEEGGRPI